MKKRLLSASLAALFAAASLTACGGSKAENTPPATAGGNNRSGNHPGSQGYNGSFRR